MIPSWNNARGVQRELHFIRNGVIYPSPHDHPRLDPGYLIWRKPRHRHCGHPATVANAPKEDGHSNVRAFGGMKIEHT